jgi:hypothetical protein
MHWRSLVLGFVFLSALSTSPGCFCGRPWGHWHHCGYTSPDAEAVVLPVDTIALPATAAPAVTDRLPR